MDSMKQLNLIDLIQLSMVHQANLVFSVKNADKGGKIVLKDGNVIHSHIEGLDGESGYNAFIKILSWIDPKEIVPSAPQKEYQHTIRVPTRSLLQVIRRKLNLENYRKNDQRLSSTERPVAGSLEEKREEKRLDDKSSSQQVSTDKLKERLSTKQPSREIQIKQLSREISMKQPSREIQIKQPSREISMKQPSREIQIKQPSREISMKQPSREIQIKQPSREIQIKQPSREVLQKKEQISKGIASAVPNRKNVIAKKREEIVAKTENQFQKMCTTMKEQLPGAIATGIFSISDGLMLALDSDVPDTDIDAMSGSHVRIWDNIRKFMKLLPPKISGELRSMVLEVEGASFYICVDKAYQLAVMTACDSKSGNLGLLRIVNKRYLNKAILTLSNM